MTARRRALTPRDDAADLVARHVAGLGLAPAGVVAGYWPLAFELDPRPAMVALATQGWVCALPRMAGKTHPLHFHHWSMGSSLRPGPFGVMEPPDQAAILTPDLVLTPLLAFDRRGNRLGYGAGFYDRTFTALRERGTDPLRLGLAFAAQEVDEVPSETSDVALDAIITETGTIRCSVRVAA